MGRVEMKGDSLPTADEISPFGSFDDDWTRKQFLGKTLEEAELLFRGNSLRFQEGLLYMSPVGFCFYVEALIRYIQSPFADCDSDIINCFAGILRDRLEYMYKYDTRPITAISPRLAAACRQILGQWDRYAIEPSIYVGLEAEYVALGAAFEKLAEQ